MCYIFIMNTSFNGNEKVFPYRRFVFDVYNRGIHTGIYIRYEAAVGATSFTLSKAVIPIVYLEQSSDTHPVAISQDLNCHLAKFLGYILHEVLYFLYL